MRYKEAKKTKNKKKKAKRKRNENENENTGECLRTTSRKAAQAL